MEDRRRKGEKGVRDQGNKAPLVPLSAYSLISLLTSSILLLITVLVPPAGADNGAPSAHLDPTLRRLIREARTGTAPKTSLKARQPGHVLITVRAGYDISKEVTNLGGYVNTVTDGEPTILTIRLPITHLERLARIPGVISVSASHPLSTALDESVVDIRADQVWNLRSRGLSMTGQGVLIGIVDTGIDWRHPDFQDANGQSRIVSIWDQTGSGSPPAGFDYGTEWHRWQIEAGLATERDTSGHGTHVAGVVAGAGAHYTGVAPGTELIVVKSPLYTASIIDAWHYIVDKARKLGRPVVINNSFGAHFGAHDGTTDYELALDALSGPGVIFTTAAGNEGQSAIHASGRVPPDETITLPVSFLDGYPKDTADVNIWYAASDSFSISVTAPTDQTFGPVEKGSLKVFEAADGTTIIVDAISAPWPVNGDNWVKVYLDATDGEAVRGDWSIGIHGDHVVRGQFDAWLSRGPYDKVFFGNYIDPLVTIREPGTAVQAITAGAYVTKTCWTAANGQQYCDHYAAGDIYPHSSRGPTRDGRRQPVVSAPGARVFAPRSADAPEHIKQIAPDDHYEGLLGTSISTAHATGVIALMLQANPTLDPATVRRILRGTARHDGYTTAGPDNRWGAGKLDALAAVRVIRGRVTHYRYLPLTIRNYHWQPTPTPTPTPTPPPTHTPTPWPPGPIPESHRRTVGTPPP